MADEKDITALPAEVEAETVESINRLADAASLTFQGTSLEMALYRAEIAYLCDPHLRSVDFFWQMMDGRMDLVDFQAHARVHHWEVMRHKVRQKAQADLIRRLSKRIVSDQLEEAADMQKLRGWFFKLLTPKEVDGEHGPELRFQVQPNSLEGVVKAYKDITTLLQMYRSEVLATLEPMAPDMHVGDADDDVGPFTENEAGEMARAILDKRRRTRQQLPAHGQNSNTDTEADG